MSEEGLSVTMDLRPLFEEMKLLLKDITDFTEPARWGFTDWKAVVYRAWVAIGRGGGSFRGKQWKALDKNTRKDESSAIPNMDTGALLRSILKMDIRGQSTGNPTMIQGEVLLIGDALPEYGRYALDEGGRNVLFFASGDDKIFANALAKWLELRHGKGKR